MGVRILLADDNPVVRQGLRALLEREPDLEVVAEAANGHGTLKLVQEMTPEVVIMDLAGAGMDGMKALRQVRGAAPDVKVIGVSIYTDRRFVVNALRAGAAGYLLKDCAFEELAQAVRAVLAQRTYISPGVSDVVIQDYVEALRQSEARFRTIFEGATIGIALVDRDGRIAESNSTLQEMLGLGRDELSQKVFLEFGQPDDAAKCLNIFKELVEGKRQSYQIEKQYVRHDGQARWGRLTVSPFAGSGVERHQFAIGMVEDITQRKQAEADIRTYQEQLRSLASELSLTEERERRRIATELHDHIGQILALAQIKLGALRESVSTSSFTAPLDEVRRLVEQSIQYTRSLTFELSPPILYDLGFEAAVEWLGELVQNQHGLRIEVVSDGRPKPMDDEMGVLLFQAVRELLVNVVKHARAQNVRIGLGREDRDLVVTVQDDGVGWSASLQAAAGGPRGFGLFSIKERLKHLGGSLKAESEEGHGTTVTMRVPMAP